MLPVTPDSPVTKDGRMIPWFKFREFRLVPPLASEENAPTLEIATEAAAQRCSTVFMIDTVVQTEEFPTLEDLGSR